MKTKYLDAVIAAGHASEMSHTATPAGMLRTNTPSAWPASEVRNAAV